METEESVVPQWQTEAYENLANAIIKSACDDYISLRMTRLEQGSYSQKDDGYIKGLKKFFYGQFFEVLTKIDPDWLISNMDELAAKKLREKNQQKEHEGELENGEKMCYMRSVD